MCKNWLAPIVDGRRAYHTRSSRGVSARRIVATVHTQGEHLYLEIVAECSNFKIFLRTRKIMVMHSNERGECCPRTLVDRKRKRYENAVDVVVRLHDPTDPSTECTAPPSSAHVQLGDVPRTPIQQSFAGEFR